MALRDFVRLCSRGLGLGSFSLGSFAPLSLVLEGVGILRNMDARPLVLIGDEAGELLLSSIRAASTPTRGLEADNDRSPPPPEIPSSRADSMSRLCSAVLSQLSSSTLSSP